MENVIQHVKIEDIVPRNHRHTLNDIKALEELAISIKEIGIKEPLKLKKINDRYEIISGNKRYKAAILAGLSKIPAIVEESDSNYLLNYITGNDDNNYLKSINNDSDIINLSELSKEYERDDFNMNNELMNNNIPQQPVQETSATPTFGGRFFPSLEDQPTNMSFNTIIEQTPVQETQPMNNFIDLTGTSNNVNTPIMSEQTQNINMNQNTQGFPSNTLQQPMMNNGTMPLNNDSVLNIENLTQNNSMVQPVQQPEPEMIVQNQAMESITTNIDNNFQEVINDFQPQPTPIMNVEMPSEPTINPNAFTENPIEQVAEPIVNPMPVMDNPINITQDIIPQPLEQPNENQPINQVPNIDNNFAQPIIEQPMPTIQPEIVPQQEVVISQEIVNPTEQIINQVPNIDNNFAQPIIEQPMPTIQPEIVPQQEVVIPQEIVNPTEQIINPPTQKDIMPVINTLKAVGINLENFGYIIRITDEDLPTSYKITIEVEK